jgi:hypothetical protein
VGLMAVVYVMYNSPIPLPFSPVKDNFLINIGLNAYLMPLREAATLSPIINQQGSTWTESQ